ncbi:hypothetical protein [Oscillatoria sp. FACHB-1406]|uniref:hypothetical protein n=1 Tax=Oscillatoria sp. FACHB-1406 TaxID=2692846 RepID=UPI001688D907|nr:hypothetical protein [Oscillatoria sp. FACHB-1406]MBD2579637.1 hypothetical protein [Oscillatoria sp. FACHB-1406]
MRSLIRSITGVSVSNPHEREPNVANRKYADTALVAIADIQNLNLFDPHMSKKL